MEQTFWEWLTMVLVAASAEPGAITKETPKSAAAVSAAYAHFAKEQAPAPKPPLKECECGKTCVAGIWKPDGKIPQQCKCQCDRCVQERKKACPNGNCPQPK